MRKHLALARLALPLLAATSAASPAAESLSSLPPDRLAERIQAELSFAEGLLALHPDRKAEWTPLLERARALAGNREAPRPVDADAFGTVAGRPAGLLLLNDGKHGHSLDGSTLALTLLRSSYEPDPLPEIGTHTMRIALVPHGGTLSPADMTRLGAAFNHPLQVVSTDLHPGRLAPAASGLAVVSPADVVVTAVKKSEADGSIVFRLLETSGKASTARVDLAPLLGVPAAAEQVDLLERPVANATARAGSGGFAVDLPAYGVASVRVRFDEGPNARRTVARPTASRRAGRATPPLLERRTRFFKGAALTPGLRAR
jgi:hypothetical protein